MFGGFQMYQWEVGGQLVIHTFLTEQGVIDGVENERWYFDSLEEIFGAALAVIVRCILEAMKRSSVVIVKVSEGFHLPQLFHIDLIGHQKGLFAYFLFEVSEKALFINEPIGSMQFVNPRIQVQGAEMATPRLTCG